MPAPNAGSATCVEQAIAITPVSAGLPVFDAATLCGDDGTAHIVLDEKVYTLRITKAGKLILTK
ncbi:hemin uptake protein HemP [Tropicimonas marinistellae]|uniref:hemin uptake protein HemP n=1 Tax=Tropicimonas marinistellae TaxID=1739787 RepID=UPI0008366D20|nr:hemin uptake protein HemP [Tropicimonas marinistellae]